MTQSKLAYLVLLLAASLPQIGSADDAVPDGLAVATFAGGCFWCMEPPFDKLPGVQSTTSGYTGGETEQPTYETVSAGGSGHAEAVRIVYDPAQVDYAELLEVFWRNVDPLTADAQFCDAGDQYRTAIFYHDEAQQVLAEESKRRLDESGRFDAPIVTEVVPAGPFHVAETYHQDYYKKSPLVYRLYRLQCGRDRRLEALWGPKG